MLLNELTRRTMRPRWSLIAALVAAATFFTLPTLAQPGDHGARIWARMSAELDSDQNGEITRDEFARGVDRFARLDRNADGVLTEADFEGGFRRGRKSGGLLGKADGDRDGTISAEEWQAFLETVDPDGDGTIDLTALRRGSDKDAPHLPPMLDRDGDEIFEREDLEAIFGELDSNGDGALSSDEMPRVRGHRRGPRGGHGPGRGMMAGAVLARAADGDANGEVSDGEWQVFLASLGADKDGAIAVESLRVLLPSRPGREEPMPEHMLSRMFDRDGDQLVELSDLEAAFSALDRDGDGALAAGELPRMRRRGRPSAP